MSFDDLSLGPRASKGRARVINRFGARIEGRIGPQFSACHCSNESATTRDETFMPAKLLGSGDGQVLASRDSGGEFLAGSCGSAARRGCRMLCKTRIAHRSAKLCSTDNFGLFACTPNRR